MAPANDPVVAAAAAAPRTFDLVRVRFTDDDVIWSIRSSAATVVDEEAENEASDDFFCAATKFVLGPDEDGLRIRLRLEAIWRGKKRIDRKLKGE